METYLAKRCFPRTTQSSIDLHFLVKTDASETKGRVSHPCCELVEKDNVSNRMGFCTVSLRGTLGAVDSKAKLC